MYLVTLVHDMPQKTTMCTKRSFLAKRLLNILLKRLLNFFFFQIDILVVAMDWFLLTLQQFDG
jgi:hypothetical protein